MDRDIKLIDDIFKLLVEKGPLSIYGIASQLQNREEYKDLSWNALRMKITRIIYRLVMAGMLEYKKGPRNAKLVDLSYNYLSDKCIYGCIPEEILRKWQIDIYKLKKNEEEEINKLKKLIDTAGLLISDHELRLLIDLSLESLLSNIIEHLEPDLFRNWRTLADKAEKYYFNALLLKKLKEDSRLNILYILASLDILSKEDRIVLQEILEEIVSDELSKIYLKYCNNEVCKKREEDNFEIYELLIDGKDDHIIGEDSLGLLMSRYIIPNIVATLKFPRIIADLKYLYFISEKVADPEDIKNLFKKVLVLSENEEYIESLYKSMEMILPYIERKAKLVEIESNVYKGFVMALSELLTEISEKNRR